jgi:hypothetical protein
MQELSQRMSGDAFSIIESMRDPCEEAQYNPMYYTVERIVSVIMARLKTLPEGKVYVVPHHALYRRPARWYFWLFMWSNVAWSEEDFVGLRAVITDKRKCRNQCLCTMERTLACNTIYEYLNIDYYGLDDAYTRTILSALTRTTLCSITRYLQSDLYTDKLHLF